MGGHWFKNITFFFISLLFVGATTFSYEDSQIEREQILTAEWLQDELSICELLEEDDNISHSPRRFKFINKTGLIHSFIRFLQPFFKTAFTSDFYYIQSSFLQNIERQYLHLLQLF